MDPPSRRCGWHRLLDPGDRDVAVAQLDQAVDEIRPQSLSRLAWFGVGLLFEPRDRGERLLARQAAEIRHGHADGIIPGNDQRSILPGEDRPHTLVVEDQANGYVSTLREGGP